RAASAHHVGGELRVAVRDVTGRAPGNDVTRAVKEDERPLLRRQGVRSLAINMRQTPIARLDDVGERDRLAALPAVYPQGLLPEDALSSPLHCRAERGNRSFGLAHQDVRMVSQLLALLDEPTCGVACLLRPLAYFSRERHAAVQMATNTLSQVGTAARAEVRAIVQKARGEFLPPNQALGARGALRHRVAPAIPEQQYTFLAGQMTGSLAVEMHNTTAADADGIVGRDHLEALRALRLGHGPSPRSGVGMR